MKVYLSSRYARITELQTYRTELQDHGHTSTARWLDGGTFENNAANAQIDVNDVAAADVLINFSDEPVEHSPHPFAARGGRHVELGLALAFGMHVIVVGPKENVFHYHPHVTVLDTWEDALAWLDEVGPLLDSETDE